MIERIALAALAICVAVLFFWTYQLQESFEAARSEVESALSAEFELPGSDLSSYDLTGPEAALRAYKDMFQSRMSR